MQKEYDELFSLMNQISDRLEKLTELARQKNIAAHNDDVLALNEIINREQAEALAFRGYEHKRQGLMKALNLNGVSLSELPQHCSEEYREQAQQCARRLKERFDLYQGCAEIARKTMETNVKDIEHLLKDMGKQDENDGPGYKAPETELPSNMKTDFHA